MSYVTCVPWVSVGYTNSRENCNVCNFACECVCGSCLMHNTSVAAVSRRNPGCGIWGRKLVPNVIGKGNGSRFELEDGHVIFTLMESRYSYMVSRKERIMPNSQFRFRACI